MSRANARRGGVSLSSLSSDLSSADTLVAEDQDYNYDKTQLPTFIAPFQFDTALPRHMTALQRLSPPLIVKCLKTATTVSHPRDILTATLSIASIDGVPSTDGGCTPDIIEPSTFIRGPNMTREVFTLHDDPWLRFVFYWFEGAGGRGGGSDENSISLSTTLGMKRVVLRARFYVYRVVVEEDGEVDEEQDPKWRDREYLGECLSEEVDVCPEGWTGGPVMGYEEVDLLENQRKWTAICHEYHHQRYKQPSPPAYFTTTSNLPYEHYRQRLQANGVLPPYGVPYFGTTQQQQQQQQKQYPRAPGSEPPMARDVGRDEISWRLLYGGRPFQYF